MSEWADQPVPDNHGIPGKTLAAQREAMGWTVEQVADQLKLAVRQVIALEEGDYANLPGPAVVRGFVRAYAKVVKLDAAPLVAQIALDTPVANDISSTVRRDSKPASFSQVRFPTNGKRASKFPFGLLAIGVLLAGAAGAAWQFGLIPQSLLGNGAQVAGSSAGDASVTVLPPPVQDKPVPALEGPAGARPADALPPVINNPVPLISVPPVVAPGAAPAPAVGAPAAQNALVLSVREDSWIEVRPVKGPKLFAGLVKAGQSQTVTVSEPVTLIVGRPSAVDVTLRGVAVPLPPVAGGRIARVNLQ